MPPSNSLTKNTIDLVGLSEIEKRDHLQRFLQRLYIPLAALAPREVPRMPDPHTSIRLQTRFYKVGKITRRKEQFSQQNFCFEGDEVKRRVPPQNWGSAVQLSRPPRAPLLSLRTTLSSSPSALGV